MWVYADQAEQYSCANAPANAPYNCTMWDRLGTDFAYVHTGMFDFTVDGTTLSISKLGSGLPDILNPCIDSFVETESYYNLCKEYGLVTECFANSFFPDDIVKEPTPLYDLATADLITDCSSGYCKCPE
jgi:hypothetical protein